MSVQPILPTSGLGHEVIFDQRTAVLGYIDGMLDLFSPAIVPNNISGGRDSLAISYTANGVSIHSTEKVATDHDILGVLQPHTSPGVDAKLLLVFGEALFFSITDVTVAEVVTRDRDPATVFGDADSKFMNEGEGVGTHGTTPRIPEIDTSLEVVSDHVCTQGDSVTVPVEDDGDALAFLDHVPTDHGAVGVLDDDAMPQVIVEVIPVAGQIEPVDALQAILVLFEVIGVDHDIVPPIEMNSGFAVVGEDGIGDPGILRAMDHVDTVPPVAIDGEIVNKKFLDSLGEDTITGLFIAADPEVSKLDAPQFVLVVLRVSIGSDMKGRFAVLVAIYDMGGSSGAFDSCLRSTDDQRLIDLHSSGSEVDDAPGIGKCIKGCLEGGVI